ncbi:MAG: hypothetical protein EGQ84_02560 [Slackia sp.]|nr:hypothetical protein [Slackia sp.]
MQTAAILTMICERVVKTGTIRNFGAPRLRLARPIRGSCFRNLAHLGFCESDHPQKSFEEISRECSLQMAPVLTISTRIVVKTGAICNLSPGAHACQAKQRMKKNALSMRAPFRV